MEELSELYLTTMLSTTADREPLALILTTKSVKVAGIDEKVTDAAVLLRTLDEMSE